MRYKLLFDYKFYTLNKYSNSQATISFNTRKRKIYYSKITKCFRNRPQSIGEIIFFDPRAKVRGDKMTLSITEINFCCSTNYLRVTNHTWAVEGREGAIKYKKPSGRRTTSKRTF